MGVESGRTTGGSPAAFKPGIPELFSILSEVKADLATDFAVWGSSFKALLLLR
jgi:hypothetical protein